MDRFIHLNYSRLLNTFYCLKTVYDALLEAFYFSKPYMTHYLMHSTV
jgi:hypothetical protein